MVCILGEAGYHRQWDSRLLNYANWEVSTSAATKFMLDTLVGLTAALVAHARHVQQQQSCPILQLNTLKPSKLCSPGAAVPAVQPALVVRGVQVHSSTPEDCICMRYIYLYTSHKQYQGVIAASYTLLQVRRLPL